MREPKAKTQLRHAIRRARERFGLYLNEDKMRGIAKKIRHGEAEFFDKQSLRVSRFKVCVDGVEMVAVYDKRRGTVVTVLTVEMAESGLPHVADSVL